MREEVISAKWMRIIGWTLMGIGAGALIVSQFLGGINTSVGMKTLSAAIVFYAPGVVLMVSGYMFERLIRRIESLEQKVEALRTGEASSSSAR